MSATAIRAFRRILAEFQASIPNSGESLVSRASPIDSSLNLLRATADAHSSAVFPIPVRGGLSFEGASGPNVRAHHATEETGDDRPAAPFSILRGVHLERRLHL
jgi:hypothetical protein